MLAKLYELWNKFNCVIGNHAWMEWFDLTYNMTYGKVRQQRECVCCDTTQYRTIDMK